MSVIAGCSLFNGVMLISDCRGTLQWPGKKNIYIDNVQKIFPLSPTSAISFVGDINIASKIIHDALNFLEKTISSTRIHPICLLNWFPRYLRYSYRKYKKGNEDVIFMVASIVPDRPNIIERAKVVALMERFRLGKLSMQRNWLPGLLVNILKAKSDYVILSDCPCGLIYSLRPPDFNPTFIKPLEFHAIGSGEGSIREIDYYADWIFSGDIGNDFIEAMALRDAVSGFIEKNKIETVGGLYPCIKIDRNSFRLIGQSMTIPFDGAKIELSAKNGRWIQKNHETGKEIEIKLPWNINFSKYKESQTFNDLKDAWNSFRTPDTSCEDS